LSKAYLAGKTDAAGLGLRAEGFYADNRVGLRLGTRATAIDRTGRRLILEGGEALSYEHLVLALGARNRPLPVPGCDLAGVRQLRGLADADALKGALADVAAVAVVGA
ncbi:FAD-dependent oxidoreductase, partial [Klebsiella pneumoniae]|uniref:FAD-dependent oxidoreductase n=1 Tax=Klebsiella pneumoniae TaxID=573 RepID=UPI0013D88BB8